MTSGDDPPTTAPRGRRATGRRISVRPIAADTKVTTAGRFRAYRSPRDGDELLLLELPGERIDWTDPAVETDADDAYSPACVPRAGYDGDLEARVSTLEPGNEIEATLRWDDGDLRFEELSVRDRTWFRFIGAATGLFEAARETWRAIGDGEAIGSHVTYGTDGGPSAVLYVFAKQPGARDLFDKSGDGVVSVDPLLDRLDDETDVSDALREMFVLRPLDEEFVLVAIALDREGLLARTMRDTYC